MRNRGLWIALLLFLALFAWLRFVEFRPKPAATAAPDSAFMAVPALNVRSISVVFRSDSTTIVRRDGRWHITSPVDYPADPIPVAALLSRCEKLTLLRSFPLLPGEAARYGLDRPACRVILREAGGRVTTLALGAPAPASPAFYVQVEGQSRVGLLRMADADDYFRRDAKGWRLTRLVDLKPATVVEVRLRWQDDVVRLARQSPDAPWLVETPFPGRAAATDMADFLKGLAHMTASDFPNDHPGSMAGYGLDPAPGEMRFIDASGDTATLRLGAPIPGTVGPPLRYAHASGNPVLLAVPANYVSLVRRSDNSFRDRHLLRFGLGRYRRMVLTAGPERLALEPDSAGAWHAVGSAAADGAVDRKALVQSWVVGEADSVVAAARWRALGGSAPAALVIEITGTDSSLQRIEVASPIPVGPERSLWPARLISAELPRPGEVLLLPESLVLPALALVRQASPAGGAR